MSRRPADRHRAAKRRRTPVPIPSRAKPRPPPGLTAQARAKIKMVKGRYRIVAGDRVIELSEVPTMKMNIKEKKIVD